MYQNWNEKKRSNMEVTAIQQTLGRSIRFVIQNRAYLSGLYAVLAIYKYLQLEVKVKFQFLNGYSWQFKQENVYTLDQY